MIGHIELTEIRKQGMKPSIVFVMDFGEPPRQQFYRAEDQLEQGSLAEVHIAPDDDIMKLDFRFLTGCVVAVNTNNRDRARLLYQAIRRVFPQSLTVSDGTFTHHEVNNAATSS